MIVSIVDHRINETLQTGAVGNRIYRVGESVYLFLEFTINSTLFLPALKQEKKGKRKRASTRLAPTINGDEVAYIFDLW